MILDIFSEKEVGLKLPRVFKNWSSPKPPQEFGEGGRARRGRVRLSIDVLYYSVPFGKRFPAAVSWHI